MGIRAIERAMNVLQELNLQPINTIAQLHARTKLPKPTLVRILKTLEEAGYVENDARQGGYQVSALVTSLSSGFHKGPLVVEAGRAWAVAITRKHKWPLAIALPDYDGMVIRFSTVPDSSMSPFHSTVNKRLCMLTRGLGLAYLSFLDKEEFGLVVDILKRSDDPENALSHHPEELKRLVDRIREDGYATRSSMVEPRNSNTIAVPIVSHGGRVLASLGLSYFKSAFGSDKEACDRYVPILQSAASAIADDLERLSSSIALDVSAVTSN
ncbi:helix-turn-helix domain-containing protein [Mesorhizobium sp. BE184]|uniref:helix-turn-helix domain-containing protein n=1 Tax=Mesorhizobium sp. BE184 TaxID=2817714 RepID=UPI0028568B6A|nr:helix-turn-helix domain-containing protein [Mesorhizobium sp. BE184]MDR7031372.1 IclR family mhp operon transcriptional activator [Mesorhizobium sp. BE184]